MSKRSKNKTLLCEANDIRIYEDDIVEMSVESTYSTSRYMTKRTIYKMKDKTIVFKVEIKDNLNNGKSRIGLSKMAIRRNGVLIKHNKRDYTYMFDIAEERAFKQVTTNEAIESIIKMLERNISQSLIDSRGIPFERLVENKRNVLICKKDGVMYAVSHSYVYGLNVHKIDLEAKKITNLYNSDVNVINKMEVLITLDSDYNVTQCLKDFIRLLKD